MSPPPAAGTRESHPSPAERSLLRWLSMIAVSVVTGIVVFIVGTVAGIWCAIVPIMGSDDVAFPHADVWMLSVVGVSVVSALTAGWATGRRLSRHGW